MKFQISNHSNLKSLSLNHEQKMQNIFVLRRSNDFDKSRLINEFLNLQDSQNIKADFDQNELAVDQFDLKSFLSYPVSDITKYCQDDNQFFNEYKSILSVVGLEFEELTESSQDKGIYILIFHVLKQAYYQKSQKKLIFLTRVLDLFCHEELLKILRAFSLIIERFGNYQIFLVIVTKMLEVMHSIMNYSQNGSMKEDGLENSSLGADLQQKDKLVDFKIIANEYNFKWNQIYVDYYWAALKQSNGYVDLDNVKLRFNEYDVAALLLSSRYWGKASVVFNLNDKNLNKQYFKPLTLVYYHDLHGKDSFQEFISNFELPSYLNIDIIKSLLTDTDGNLKFNFDGMDKIIENLSLLKHLNVDIFIKSLKGRQLLQMKNSQLPQETSLKYAHVINSFAHASDFFFIHLITADSKDIDDVLTQLNQLN